MNLILKQIIKLFIQYDPEGLISLGAPIDEYDSEAHFLFESLDKDSEYRFQSFLEYWKDQFGGYQSKDAAGKLRKILEGARRYFKNG